MGSTSERKGREAEAWAASYFISRGYLIREKRYACRFGDIDLILEKGNKIIFVEVKYRSSLAYGRPAEAVTPAKRRKILQTARYYLCELGTEDPDCRFDVLECWMEDGQIKCCHLKNAFEG